MRVSKGSGRRHFRHDFKVEPRPSSLFCDHVRFGISPLECKARWFCWSSPSFCLFSSCFIMLRSVHLVEHRYILKSKALGFLGLPKNCDIPFDLGKISCSFDTFHSYFTTPWLKIMSREHKDLMLSYWGLYPPLAKPQKRPTSVTPTSDGGPSILNDIITLNMASPPTMFVILCSHH